MISRIVTVIKTASYKRHLLFSFVLRLLLIVYGDFHDEHFEVPYTDIDYKVFTDAARCVLENDSPYRRHTYRYTPLIAWMLTPNILVHRSFGKVLFSIIDIVAAFYIKKIIEHSMLTYGFPSKKIGNELGAGRCGSNIELASNLGMFVWLYNPITIGIATRGNSDSIAGCLVLLSLYLLQCKDSYFLAGFVHGLAVHVRLYPLMYSLSLFLHLSSFSCVGLPNLKAAGASKCSEVKGLIERTKVEDTKMTAFETRKMIFRRHYLFYLVPNTDQIKLITGCISSVSVATGLFYYLYGYEFLYESYIYHLVRKDTRHNFSLYFYLQYLTAGVNVGLWQKVLMNLPQLVLVLVFSVKFGLRKSSLNFVIFMITCVIVTYNSVLTSQYFVWILAVLPLCMWQIKMSKSLALFLTLIWAIAQGLWLFSAYLLEFRGWNVFAFIWLHSVSFFCANIAIMAKVVDSYVYCTKRKLS